MAAQPDPTATPLPRRAARTTVAVWIGLSVITVIAWRLSPESAGPTTHLGKGLVGVIVVLGMAKCRLIIRYFMEVRHGPRWLRVATDVWLAVLWLTLLGIYLFS